MLYRVIVSPRKPLDEYEVVDLGLDENISKYSQSESPQPTTPESVEDQEREPEPEIEKDWYKKVMEGKEEYASISCNLSDSKGFMLKEISVGVNEFRRVVGEDGEVSNLEHQGESTIDPQTFSLVSGFRLSWRL